MRVNCPGVEVGTGVMGEALCLDSMGAPVAWEVQPEFDVSQLDHDQLGLAFSVGFSIIGTIWLGARVIKFGLSIIKSI